MSTQKSLAPARVLLILAHPDDGENHCGGTVAQWAATGAWIGYIVATSGNRGTYDPTQTPHHVALTREAEQDAAARQLGIEQVVYLRYTDGELGAVPSLTTELAALLRYFRPDVVCTHDPWQPYQVHPDHRALGMAVVDAIYGAWFHHYLPGLTAAGLAPHTPNHLLLWEAGEPNYFVDITATWEQKRQAVACHTSLLRERSRQWEAKYTRMAAEAGRRIGVPYAEAFRRIDFTPGQ